MVSFSCILLDIKARLWFQMQIEVEEEKNEGLESVA
jgi:hypothetical protein